MEKGKMHWAFESDANLQARITLDFIIQVEERIAEKGWTHADMASALGVTEGRVSQLFNNDPGNLTLRSMMKIASVVGLMLSVVAYDLGEKARETGPVASGVFESGWRKLGKPLTHWDIECAKGVTLCSHCMGSDTPKGDKGSWRHKSESRNLSKKKIVVE